MEVECYVLHEDKIYQWDNEGYDTLLSADIVIVTISCSVH